MPKEPFEHAGMTRLISFLYAQKGESVGFTIILNALKPLSSDSLRRTIEIAKKFYLINEIKEQNWPFGSKITLTERGQLIGEHLEKILAVLKSKGDLP